MAAYWWLNPNPPNQVTLATGPAKRLREEFARYQKALAADGIEVLLLPSEGSSANLQLLREGKADLAFVQGGTAELQPDDPDLLVSLGSLCRAGLAVLSYGCRLKVTDSGRPDSLRQLRGLRVNALKAAGAPGTSDRPIARCEPRGERAGETVPAGSRHPPRWPFWRGKLDALVFASAPESLMVQMLLQTPGVRLMDFAQHEAYGRKFPFSPP